ncbi:hypothetical protein DZC52_03265 [Wenzhouxiangella sediminis]|uniref:Uncharacterized protein n=2 Tax=Wenzhouxiangella sediminis TaxID=1792836 RepID=A0A3E1KBP8_9GAMM|nr:hypothetical protein DZC52_03265 [Wenzhouxiangella sediminis]
MTMSAAKTSMTRIALLLILAVGLSGPAWGVWPTSAGGSGDDLVTASAVGPSGDVFVTGTFTGQAVFGGDTQISARGTRDIFVARYSQSGNLRWVQRAGGNRADSADGIVVDSSGNVYITGSFVNSADFGSFEMASATLEPDIFVAKLNGAGSWTWVRTATGEGVDASVDIGLIPGNPAAIPPSPDILVIAGHYQCGTRFTSPEVGASDEQNILLGQGSCSGGPPDDQHYLAALDSDGVWQWASNSGVAGGVSSAISSLDVDQGRVMVVGRHNGPLDLGGASLPTPPGSPAEFIAESPWQESTDTPSSPPNSFFIPNQPGVRASDLELDRNFDLTAIQQPKLRFNHRFRLDSCYDLAVLSYSTDGGNNWNRVPPEWFESGGYNGAWNGWENNPISGPGWCHQSPDWPEYNSVTVSLDSIANESSVRFRWRLGEGQQVGIEGWWVDDFALTDGAEPLFSNDLEPEDRQFIARLSNPTSANPTWSWARPVEPEFPVAAIHVSDLGLPYIAGRVLGAFTPWGYSQQVTDVGAAVAKLDPNSGDTDWIEVADGGQGTALASVGTDIFLAGHFSGTAVFKSGPDGTLQSAGERDLFVSLVDDSGSTQWVTGGDRYNAETAVPGQAGGSGDSVMTSLATDGLANLYVTGAFSDSIVFGQEAELVSAAGQNGFVANLDLLGVWFEVKTWLVGEAVTPPTNAENDEQAAAPEIYIDGQLVTDAIGTRFFWAKPAGADEAVLTVLDAIDGVEIHWRVDDEPLSSSNRIVSVGRTSWPGEACTPANDSECYQVHIAGAPVELDEPGSGFRFVNQFVPQSQPSDASVNAGVMKASRPGFTVLLYVEGATTDPFEHPASVEVVRTFRPNQSPDYVDNIRWDIGEPIVEPYHNQIGRTGYVLNEDAFYDGVGADAAYDRQSRTGHIIPVNKVRPNRLQDADKEMVVAWYRRNAMGIYWPQRAMHYAPDWPLDPDRIIIASEQGGEVLGQEPLGPQQYPDLRIYQQPLVSEPGYNPNATHAFFAPSNTGTGILALFALRADFGINLRDDFTAPTDPYVLVKYWSEDLGRWAFRTYYVTATGAGFDGFQYGGEAGTAVAPPYPLSTLPGCDETLAVGQAANDPQPPPPFFKDYKNGLWSKSAGNGALLFWYPLQPGFSYDITNNDFPDATEGQCIPWMARLPEERGGTVSPNEPLAVNYTFTWPSNPPQLIPGETLLKQKRGLPNIYQQDAVEVVFDEHREAMEASGGAAPEDTLVQLIDPLNPRYVYLDNLSGLGSQLDPETGWRIITGDADGLLKLPVSIRERLRYDPLNKRLIFSGVFDDTIAGEPLLMLNIMSFREARQLKVLDGSADDEAEDSTNACQDAGEPCGWAEAVEALLRLTRNPQGIETVCVDSQINPQTGERQCTLSRDVDRGELLAAFDDPQGDGFLQPYKATGVQPALTAGATQSVGWVTLAFNNDPTLNPAPVSVQIIRVDCLRQPPPPDPADILSSYQGQLNVIMPDNIFDEQLTLRHSGDFGGDPDALEFEWYFQPDQDGTPPFPLPEPETGQLNGWQRFPVDDPQGAVEITVEGANIQTLSDNWYVARYRGLPVCNNQSEWSLWAGSPGATPLDQRAQLGLGWVKRVIERLNPFEARVQDFHSSPTNTYSSMLTQLGERYEGDIPLTSNPEVLNDIGLIEAYTTVMRRAMDLSVNAVPPVDYGPVNKAILNVATRIVDFYALLGNEAYADAQDPTVGLLTSGEFASLAPTVHPFQNQLASVLEEELVLLRGRDDSQATTSAPPVYNRLFWNFTTGDGEAAYALNYDIGDKNTDGVIDEFDARIQYPQGHGDAWGQYLTAMKTHYSLLKHPFFTWEPTQEAVPVAGVPIQVDFFDERKFAKVAAAKARTGAEIVNLTYRQFYVEDPAAQWQGYKDDDPERAWGLSEWARRAGQGAYFDWVVGNAILPDEDPDPGNFGIQKVDRTTVEELEEIVSNFDSIQQQLDQADRGLNPLGLAKGVVPFDIDPIQVDRYGKTHFEQVYDRAVGALENAVKVWDFANQLNRMLRFNQDSVDDLAANSRANERNYKNRLIEIFGYPYADDVGPGGLYPAGYDGPDVYHYQYIDVLEMAGKDTGLLEGFDIEGDVEINRFDASYDPLPGGVNYFGFDEDAPFWEDNCDSSPLGSGCALGPPPEGDDLTVEMVTYDSPAFGFTFGKPPEWTGQRRATGSIQNVLHDMFMARIDLQRSIVQYENLRSDISDLVDTIEATYNLRNEQLQIANNERRTLNQINIAVQTLNQSAKAVKAAGNLAAAIMDRSSECIPKSIIVGVAAGGDTLSVARCTMKTASVSVNSVTDAIGEGLEIAANVTGATAQDVSQLAALETQVLDSRLELFNMRGQFDEMLRREPVLRMEMFSRAEAIQQLYRKYLEELAKGQRIMAELVQFRKNGAAAVQEHRYKDMAFRVFRNDALQKYRAAFDLAARYAYLAATAYDYDTNLLGSDSRAGRRFLTDIVRERSLGQILGGDPVPGSRGLADPLGRMAANFEVLKGQMGFNNPQIETNRFSLRRELFRIEDTPEGDEQWQRILENARVDDLWQLEEFRRFARPPQPESAGPLPALVFRFPTTVSFGLNFFHWPLGPGDSAYDASRFSTRVRSVGTWFRDYAGLPLSETPRIYLFPTGADVLRSPSYDDFRTRDWQVIDQVLPVPFPIGSQELQNANWLPLADTLSNAFNEVRRYSQFRAHHFTEPFDDTQVIADSRLIGRSVWNREWMLIIPGGSLLADPDEGLDTFIEGAPIPDTEERDGEGVSDIRIFFTTYSYSGN